MIPTTGETKARIPRLSPTEASVALWVDFGDFKLLLGGDLDKRGLMAVAVDQARPPGRASVFKIPHHGSESSDEPAVWHQLLQSNPVAIVTPWRRVDQVLPSKSDANRILSRTSSAYLSSATSDLPGGRKDPQNHTVARTLRESGARLRRLAPGTGSVRLRRFIGAGTA